MNDQNKAELRRLVQMLRDNADQCACAGFSSSLQDKAADAVLSLLDELDSQANQFKEWQARHHANYCSVAEERDQLRAEVEALREELGGIKNVSTETTKAMKRLCLHARTSGGTAGPDQGLMDACEQAEKMLSLGGIGRAYMDGADAAMAKEGSANG
ncbi:hypothetical protein M1D96_06440 [Pseudomonas sp. D1-3]